MSRFHLLSFIGILASPLIVCAAPFQDLNFDSANTNNLADISGSGDYAGPISDLLPGWQLQVGTFVPSRTGFNLSVPGTGYATIFSPTYGGHIPVVGLYSYAMIPGDPQLNLSPFSLSQMGDLPADVRSIHFLSYGSPLELQVNGSLISLTYTPIASQPGWSLSVPVFDAMGDISSFAGETVELKFTTLTSSIGYNGLDEIYFSTIAVPEPSTLLLFSLGGLALLVRRIRRE